MYGQARDRIPREYTNPEEVVIFDRSTSFQRALDVINEFAQENLNKVIIDRTATEGNLGISIPPMHWWDALDLMLRVKDLALIEQKEFFEIVTYQSQNQSAQPAAATGTQGTPQGEDGEILATIDSREVRINAIFFEGSRRALREIGVDWSTLTEDVPATIGSFVNPQQGGGGQGGGGGGGGGQGGQGSGQLPATAGFEDQFVSVNAKGAQSVSQNVFNSLINFGEIGNSGISVQALFSAFEADNLGEILASPSVKVMDGQEGRIQVGQDFSIKQRDFAGNVTDQFFSVGTILTVTPTIIEQNDTTIIHVDVEAERSSAQPDPVSTIVNKQNAQTQAILVDGEATAIAGLYRSEVAEVRRGVPILKDLPPWLFGLRFLFGYNSKDYQMRELVILVQAEIEPTIQERYGEEIQNKFEVLNDERRRYRDEIQNKDKYSPTRLEMLGSDEEEQAERPEQELEDSPDDSTEMESEPEQPRQEPVQNESETEDQQEETVVDPEVKSEPVPLDLGGEPEEEQQPDPDIRTTEEADSVESQDTDDLPAEENGEPEPSGQAAQQDEMPPIPKGEQGTVDDFEYFIIGASFTNRENAERYRDDLAEKGFNAMIINEPGSRFHFVAYNGFRSIADAQKGLADIQEYYNSEAWLYVKD